MNFILPKRARAPSRRSGTKLENTSLSTDVVQGFCSDKIHVGLLLSFKNGKCWLAAKVYFAVSILVHNFQWICFSLFIHFCVPFPVACGNHKFRYFTFIPSQGCFCVAR